MEWQCIKTSLYWLQWRQEPLKLHFPWPVTQGWRRHPGDLEAGIVSLPSLFLLFMQSVNQSAKKLTITDHMPGTVLGSGGAMVKD